MKRLRTLTGTLALMLLTTGPVFSDYSIPVSTTAQGGGRGSNQTHSLAFVVGQPSPLVTASNMDHTLSTGLITLLLDVSPPAILHSPPTAAVPHLTDLEITADIGDERSGVETAVVFHREGGSSTFREAPMSRDGGTFLASIPPSAVTERGLLYYIEAADSAGNKSRYPAGAPDSVIGVRVWFEDLASAFELPAGQYRMVSLPGSTDAHPDQVLVDDLGEYDKTAWRLGRWNQSPQCSAACYDEYPDIADMDRGRAFWLITRNATGFDFSGLSTLPESPFKVHLETGWNQIGTPFALTTDWLSTVILFSNHTYTLNEEHVVGADTLYVEDNLVSYDGSYHGHQSRMEPWKGYWIYNGSTTEVDLLISPWALTPAVVSSPAPQGEFDTVLRLVVSSDDFPDRTGTAGLSPEARDGWDPMDHREPPPFGDYIRLVFDKSDWGKHRGSYMTDVRHSSENGARWEFRVEASKSTQAKITAVQEGRLPAGWSVLLYDPGRGLRMGLEDLPYAFRAGANRRFGLIAGTDEFIHLQEAEAGINLKSQIVAAAPNPFRQSVDITCFTPAGTRMALDVFSVEGRLIRSFDLVGTGGIRRINWDGRSDENHDVGPGLYFARLRAGRATDTAKILKIR